jgi:phytoene synthase
MDDIVNFSRERIEKGSKSFAAAARLFDSETRSQAYMLYAWCRHCDDIIDGQELGFVSAMSAPTTPSERLAELRRKTEAAVRGEWDEMVFGALHRVVSERQLPEQHLLDHLDGFAMDVEERRYETLDDTLAYCYHVAGVVGVMMSIIMGVRDPATLDRASDLGIAFQLTNITRDVMDDAAIGRIYLPEQWLIEAGVEPTPRAIADPANREAVHDVTQRLLAVSDRFYISARHGIASLPFRSAWAIASARFVYRDIGRLVRSHGAAAWDQRARVSRGRKLYGIARSLATIARSHAHGRIEAVPSRHGLWTRPRTGPGFEGGFNLCG